MSDLLLFKKYFSAIAVVVLISTGQILFKLTANKLSSNIDIKAFFTPVFLSACILYAAATILWCITLRNFPLSKLYGIMALSFVFVPIVSHFIFGDEITFNTILGMIFIVTGIIFSIR